MMDQQWLKPKDTDAETTESGLRMQLTDQSLNSLHRQESKKAIVELRNEMRELWSLISDMRSKTNPQKFDKL